MKKILKIALISVISTLAVLAIIYIIFYVKLSLLASEEKKMANDELSRIEMDSEIFEPYMPYVYDSADERIGLKANKDVVIKSILTDGDSKISGKINRNMLKNKESIEAINDAIASGEINLCILSITKKDEKTIETLYNPIFHENKNLNLPILLSSGDELEIQFASEMQFISYECNNIRNILLQTDTEDVVITIKYPDDKNEPQAQTKSAQITEPATQTEQISENKPEQIAENKAEEFEEFEEDIKIDEYTILPDYDARYKIRNGSDLFDVVEIPSKQEVVLLAKKDFGMNHVYINQETDKRGDCTPSVYYYSGSRVGTDADFSLVSEDYKEMYKNGQYTFEPLEIKEGGSLQIIAGWGCDQINSIRMGSVVVHVKYGDVSDEELKAAQIEEEAHEIAVKFAKVVFDIRGYYSLNSSFASSISEMTEISMLPQTFGSNEPENRGEGANAVLKAMNKDCIKFTLHPEKKIDADFSIPAHIKIEKIGNSAICNAASKNMLVSNMLNGSVKYQTKNGEKALSAGTLNISDWEANFR